MRKYTKPSVKVKKVRINSFLSSNKLRSPLSNFNDFFTTQPAFATSITPPGTGTAGLKDKKGFERNQKLNR